MKNIKTIKTNLTFSMVVLTSKMAQLNTILTNLVPKDTEFCLVSDEKKILFHIFRGKQLTAI